MLRQLATLLFCVLVLNSAPLRSEAGASSGNLEANLQQAGASTASSVFFTKNMGQWPDSILFRADAAGATIWIAKDAIYYQFTRVIYDESTNRHSGARGKPGSYTPDSVEIMMVKASFVGANPNVQVESEGERDFKFNYFLGNDPSKWATDVPSYEAVTLSRIYQGIELHFRGNERGNLRCEYILAADADLGEIRVEYEGIDQIPIRDGRMTVAMSSWGEIVGLVDNLGNSTEFIGMASNDSRVSSEVSSGVPRNGQAVGLDYSSYLGGTGFDDCWDIAVDGSGCAYVSGFTASAGFPTLGAFDASYNGGSYDVFVSKFTNSGDALVYSTFLGGTDQDISMGIAVDSVDCAHVTGSTRSADFPTQNAYDGSINGTDDAFVTKLSALGNALVYSTFLGGASVEEGHGIALDRAGSSYVVGRTASPDFPTQNPYDASHNGDWDVFITKFSTSGSVLLYSTYLGGAGTDAVGGYPLAIAVDTFNCAYVTGQTASSDFPMQGAYDASFNGFWDVFVTKLSNTGSSLVYSTYLGGSETDFGLDIAIDEAGCAYVTGYTQSFDFPLQNPFDATLSASQEVFVTKFSTSGNTLVYSTFLGGSSTDSGIGIAVDSLGCAYVAGEADSPDFQTQNPYDETHNGNEDAFVAKFSASGSALGFSTFLGGTGTDYALDIAIDRFGNAYLVGRTFSSDFPMQNAYDGSYNGDADVFIAKLSFHAEDCSGVSPITWSIGNQVSSMWPSSHWNQFGYCEAPSPCSECCINCSSSDFPDWTSFVGLIGEDEAYFDPPPGVTRFRPSALNQWRAIKGPWSGSCFGFAAMYYLYLDGFRSLASDFSGSANLSQVPLSGSSREFINDYFHYQYGFAQQKLVASKIETMTPSSTLVECQEMFAHIPRNDRVMMMFNQSGSGAHALAAYRCLQDGGDPDTWYLYVHDSNFPSDTTKRIAINTVANTWSYSAQPGWGGSKGLFLMDSVSNYMSPLIVEDTSTIPQVMTIYFGETDSATFVTPAFGAFGFNADSLFGEIPGSFPIIPADGQESAPIGYFLPTAYYNWQIVGVESGQCIINYGDNIQWRVGGAKAGIISASVTAAAQNVNIYAGAAKNLQDMLAVCDTQFVELLIIEPDSEMVIRIEDIDIAPGDSVRFSIVSASVIKVDNYGTASNYDLSVQIVSASADDRFYHADIPITANTAHSIHFDWRQSNDSVDIDVDVDRNGSIDSTLIVSDQATPVFFCGDADGNTIVTISDAVFLINYIFSGGPAPSPILAGDADCNGIVTISDAVYLINYIFSGGPSPCSTCP